MQGTWQRSLGLYDESGFVPAQPPERAGASRGRERKSEEGHPAVQSMETFPEGIGRHPVYASPEHASRCIEKKEPSPGHAVGAGQDGRERAQQGNEPAEEHDLAAVLREQVLPDFDAPGIQSCEMAVAQQDGVAESSAD